MIKSAKTKFLLLSLPFLLISKLAAAQSEWEGTWLYARYYNGMDGSLQISDCQDNKCKFDIGTFNGAHTCSVSGSITIDKNHAIFTETTNYFENEPPATTLITMVLNPEKRIITVKREDNNSNRYCGMQGYFEGEYEHEDNPLRYKTGFDCWGKELSETQKVICASEDLAAADLELEKNYSSVQTKEWIKQRDECGKDEKCLWEFYVKSIRKTYETNAKKTLNLYEYLGVVNNDEIYYPTDFTLLNDYFLKNMIPKDYEAWRPSLVRISLDRKECDECHYMTYGVAGLYTIYESAFYINKKEIWLAFISANLEDGEDKYIIVYAPAGKTENDIPEKYDDWLTRLKKYYPKGIKLKNFKENKHF